MKSQGKSASHSTLGLLVTNMHFSRLWHITSTSIAASVMFKYSFMLDNASNNNTMVNAIAGHTASEGIKLNATWAQLRCMPHTIHLVAIKVS